MRSGQSYHRRYIAGPFFRVLIEAAAISRPTSNGQDAFKGTPTPSEHFDAI